MIFSEFQNETFVSYVCAFLLRQRLSPCCRWQGLSFGCRRPEVYGQAAGKSSRHYETCVTNLVQHTDIVTIEQ